MGQPLHLVQATALLDQTTTNATLKTRNQKVNEYYKLTVWSTGRMKRRIRRQRATAGRFQLRPLAPRSNPRRERLCLSLTFLRPLSLKRRPLPSTPAQRGHTSPTTTRQWLHHRAMTPPQDGSDPHTLHEGKGNYYKSMNKNSPKKIPNKEKNSYLRQ